MLNLWIIDGNMIEKKISQLEADAYFKNSGKEKDELTIQAEILTRIKEQAIKIKGEMFLDTTEKNSKP